MQGEGHTGAPGGREPSDLKTAGPFSDESSACTLRAELTHSLCLLSPVLAEQGPLVASHHPPLPSASPAVCPRWQETAQERRPLPGPP